MPICYKNCEQNHKETAKKGLFHQGNAPVHKSAFEKFINCNLY